MTGFINGIRTTRTISKKTTSSGSDFSVIGLIGIAPIFDVKEEDRTINSPKLVTTKEAGVKNFGYNRSDFTIPAALEAIYARNDSAKVIVINVFDPEKHKTSETVTKVFDAKNEIKIERDYITNLVIKKGESTLTADTDYTVKDNLITIKTGSTAVQKGDEVTLTYDYADVSKVETKDIIGGVDVDGKRSGIEAFKDTVALCRVKPRILIAPQFSTVTSVVNALDSLAAKFRAHVYIDPPQGTSLENAIKGRGTAGEINLAINSENVEIIAPWVKVYNSYEGKYELRPASAYAAATRTYTDNEYGLHYSLGNQVIAGIEGTEYPVYFDIEDENSDSNLFNGNGITTIIYDDGWRFWGNRNSTFPGNENINSFTNEVRLGNYIDDGIAKGSRQFMAIPLLTPNIDDIVNFGKQFLANLALKGWIVGGDCWYNPAKNNADLLAKGKCKISRKFVGPPPLEELEYESDIDITYLENIGGEG